MENPLIYTREADNSDSKGMGGLGHFKAIFTSSKRRALYKDIGTSPAQNLNLTYLEFFFTKL